MKQHFDAIIIGGGQAGNPLAQNLADKGWQVALIEREHLGGSCINYGCTPTKKMLASAQVAQQARRAAEYGVRAGEVSVDLPRIVALKNELVGQWRQGLVQKAEQRPNIQFIRGEASFTGPQQVRVGETELEAENIFINTGTTARILPIEGLKEIPYLTNHNILDLKELPAHLLVIGGSYIGLEFGQMFRRFGSQVTVIEHEGQLVAREDEDVSRTLQQALEAEGIHFLLNSQATRVARQSDGTIEVTVAGKAGDDSQVLSGSHLLVAVGRQPNSAELNLEAAGIQHNKGWIQVNEYLETNVPGVYALGDVNGGPAFTDISYNDFQIVFHNLFSASKWSTRDRIVPYAMFTDPELGRVGMTEKEARQAGRNIQVGKIPMSAVARAAELNEMNGLMKIVVEAESGQILGAAILSASGGELVQTLMALMYARAPWTVLHKAVFIHPTLAEGLFSLMDSIQ